MKWAIKMTEDQGFKLITSKRGKLKFVRGNYLFYKDKVIRNKIFWKCYVPKNSLPMQNSLQ